MSVKPKIRLFTIEEVTSSSRRFVEAVATGQSVLVSRGDMLFAHLDPQPLTASARTAIMDHNEALGWEDKDAQLIATYQGRKIKLTVLYLAKPPLKTSTLYSIFAGFLDLVEAVDRTGRTMP